MRSGTAHGMGVLPPEVSAVVFDVGETVVDETRQWTELAYAAGVTPFTLMAALGATIEAGEDHRTVWDRLGIARPTMPVAPIRRADLYPDVEATLLALRGTGRSVGLAGNQPEAAEAAPAALGLPVDVIASSARGGVEKPSPRFFERLASELDLPPEWIAYVGDRLDDDVLPARAAGKVAVLVRRGPWGILHTRMPEVVRATVVVEHLGELLDGDGDGSADR